MPLNVLLIGDVVGKLGRRTVAAVLPRLRQELDLGLVICNGENTAGGRGLTPGKAEELYNAGVDVITGGNHIWENREVYPMLKDESVALVRPINYPDGVPGRGIFKRDGVAILNAMGRTFMGISLEDPFRALDHAIEQTADCRVRILDFHAEATSEKIALGYYLDGRVSAVVGTHTHVPTSDTRILPKGTAYVTDLGMCGALNSVIGMDIERVLERFLTQLPNRFDPVEKGPAVFNSVLVKIDPETGRALHIERVDRELA
jgi:2',3'-cyclic-nucleotide 2'-phosphodiesterase